MCLMCMEILKGKMRPSEGRVALKELIATASDREKLAHYKKLMDTENDEELLELIEKQQTERT